jgi:hypothetical protein
LRSSLPKVAVDREAGVGFGLAGRVLFTLVG